MALRRITIYGDPVLRRKAPRVRQVDDELRAMLDDMVETMLEAPGLGLAAPQVGQCQRCIVVRDQPDSEEEEERIFRIINPRLRAREGEQVAYEGCLSLPTLHGEVKRAQRVIVTGLSPEGEELRLEAEGLLARVLQHEMDHLDGVLFTDRVESGTLGWMVPDEKEPDGYRFEDATPEEITTAFEKLRQRQEAREG